MPLMSGQEKCSRYWPEKGHCQTWGNFITESVNEEQFADYVIREFTLKNQVSDFIDSFRMQFEQL